jgi:drug/metabolite transporter (DMT)-like permease
MKNLLLLVGLIALGVGAYFLYNYLYQRTSDEKTNLVLGGVFSVAALICFAVFFFMKFHDEADQDISITKF